MPLSLLPFLCVRPIPTPDKAQVGVLTVRDAQVFLYPWASPLIHPLLKLERFDLHSLLQSWPCLGGKVQKRGQNPSSRTGEARQGREMKSAASRAPIAFSLPERHRSPPGA